ncbi:MAG: N-acetylmuramoyl-L-alanine amidase, partial [Candidatus Limnocylindria bacterium]
VIPAPGSSSTVYAPNPAAVVVAIDPGHGGCLDWGVPDPSRRGEAYAEKTMTLAIGLELRRLLQEQGVTVVLTRDADVALAGDDYPDLDCNGPAWRDVNGDGQTGFHPDDPEGAIRTRDELQARLDLANLVRADVFVSIHINSLTQDGVVFEIAATETFYTDETAWGAAVTEGLARTIQDEVVAAMAGAAGYDRQDRGIKAHNLYVVAPPLLEETPERPDRRKQPTRGALMPSILTEVGSITLAAEQDLLASPAGQAAAAEGIFRALAGHFAARPLAVRYALPDLEPAAPAPVDGDGPMFWIPGVAPGEVVARLTNSGTRAWPDGVVLLAGWEASDQPYLRLPPPGLQAVPVKIPALGPGESVELALPVAPPAGAGRWIGWFSLATRDGTLADLGSPPLQVAVD